MIFFWNKKILVLLSISLMFCQCGADIEVVHFVEKEYVGRVVELYDKESPALSRCGRFFIVIHDSRIIRHSTSFNTNRVNEKFKIGKFKGCDSLNTNVDLYVSNEVSSIACEENYSFYYWEVSTSDTIRRKTMYENSVIAEKMICGENIRWKPLSRTN